MEYGNNLKPTLQQNQNVQNKDEELYNLLSKLSKNELLNISFGDLNFEGNKMSFKEALEDAFYSFEESGKNIEDLRNMVKSKKGLK